MITPGLVSVTFRKLTPQEIVDLVARAGLRAIEWGGDVHVPHGDLARAAEVARMTRDAGLVTAAYGSYYRVGHEEPMEFERILETALALDAPTVRVWAGKRGSADADPPYRELVVEEASRIAHMAKGAQITVSFEFHGKTLTDTTASAVRLFEEVPCPAACAYWQPPVNASVEACLEGLAAMLPRLSNLHVFQWSDGAKVRHPLADGADCWPLYFKKAAATGRDHAALLEFVKDDSPESFLHDAETLKAWLAAVNG